MHGDFPLWFILILLPEFWFVFLPLCAIISGYALYNYLKYEKEKKKEDSTES